MSPLNHCFAMPHRQRGAIGLVAALTLGLALLFTVTVLDSGRLYLEKRSLQRIADMAALEAASRKGNCNSAATASLYATQSATRNGFIPDTDGRTLNTLCGTLSVNAADGRRAFVANAASTDAIRVVASHPVPASIAAGITGLFSSGPQSANVQLSAVAVASTPLPPLAQLTIKTTLASVDSAKGAMLDLLWGGLLGGTLNITAVGYEGLLNTEINLLKLFDQLAIDANIKAGDYTSLLNSDIKLTDILSATTKVLPQNSPIAKVAVDKLNAIIGNAKIKLGDLLSVQSGTPSAGLDANLNLFSLLEGIVQIANSQSAAYATLPANLLGLAGITTRVKVIEPPRLSAPGNPELAKANPTGPNAIYVRTAQIRTLISVDLSPINSVLSTAQTLLSPVMTLLAVLTATDLKIAPDGLSLDVSIEVASASSRVTDFDCSSDADKSLTVETKNTLATIKIGKINSSAWNSSSGPLSVTELALVDIGTRTCPLLSPCQPRVSFGGGGLGIKVDNSVGGSTLTYTYKAPNSKPAEIGQPPIFNTFSSSNIVSSLQQTLSGITLVNHPPQNNNIVGSLLSGITSALSTVLNLLATAIGNILGPLLDPLMNNVLKLLGVDLAKVDVGANLSCHPRQALLVI